MSVNYGKMAANAARKIEKYGATAVLCRHVTGGEYDTTTGSMEQGQELRHPCRAVLSKPDGKLIDGTLVLAGDMVALLGVPGKPFVPEIGDWLEIKGVKWAVMREIHVKPGDAYILFKVLVRK